MVRLTSIDRPPKLGEFSLLFPKEIDSMINTTTLNSMEGGKYGIDIYKNYLMVTAFVEKAEK